MANTELKKSVDKALASYLGKTSIYNMIIQEESLSTVIHLKIALELEEINDNLSNLNANLQDNLVGLNVTPDYSTELSVLINIFSKICHKYLSE